MSRDFRQKAGQELIISPSRPLYTGATGCETSGHIDVTPLPGSFLQILASTKDGPERRVSEY